MSITENIALMNTALNNISVYRTTVKRVSKLDAIHNCLLGYSAAPAETVRLRTKEGKPATLEIVYDLCAQHTLITEDCLQMITSAKESRAPIQLNTITGCTSTKWDICTIEISNTISIEAILVKNMNISTYTMEHPSC